MIYLYLEGVHEAQELVTRSGADQLVDSWKMVGVLRGHALLKSMKWMHILHFTFEFFTNILLHKCGNRISFMKPTSTIMLDDNYFLRLLALNFEWWVK